MQKKNYYSEFKNTQKNTCVRVSFYRHLRLQMRSRFQPLRYNTEVFYKQHFYSETPSSKLQQINLYHAICFFLYPPETLENQIFPDFFESIKTDHWYEIGYTNFTPSSANPTKWSNTLKQFVGQSTHFLVCLTILWVWSLKGCSLTGKQKCSHINFINEGIFM